MLHTVHAATFVRRISHLAAIASDALQMNGTLLPPMETGVVWTIGLEAEVTWQVLTTTAADIRIGAATSSLV
jgi:hypothetical protein